MTDDRGVPAVSPLDEFHALKHVVDLIRSKAPERRTSADWEAISRGAEKAEALMPGARVNGAPPKISSAYVQSIGVFCLPELISEKWRFLSRQSKSSHLHERLLEGKSEDFRGCHLTPRFDFRRSGPYSEEFWEPFQSSAPLESAGAPRHFPFRIRMAEPGVTPADSTPFAKYTATLRGFLFPYGGVAVRFAEYIRPKKPISTWSLMDFLSANLRMKSQEITRKGILANAKDFIFKSVVPKPANFPHDLSVYRIVHVSIDRPLERPNDGAFLAPLLAFSVACDKVQKHLNQRQRNQGHRGQVLRFGKYAAVAHTPDLWLDTKLRGRRCFRDRLSSTAELALIQARYWESYRERFRVVGEKLRLRKRRPWASVKTSLFQEVSLEELESLNAIFRFQDAFARRSSGRIRQWKTWYATLRDSLFPEQNTAVGAVRELNRLYTATDAEAARVAGSVAAALTGLLGAVGSTLGAAGAMPQKTA